MIDNKSLFNTQTTTSTTHDSRATGIDICNSYPEFGLTILNGIWDGIAFVYGRKNDINKFDSNKTFYFYSKKCKYILYVFYLLLLILLIYFVST